MDNSTRNENLQNVSTEQPSPGGDSEISIHINITEINGSSIKTDITTENGNNDNTSDSTRNTPTTQVDFMNKNVTNIIDITTSGVEESTTSSSEEEVISTESTMDNSTRNENLQNFSTEQPSPGGDSEISIHINITEINGSSIKTDITTENGNNDKTSDSTRNAPTTQVDFMNENVTNIIDITTSGVEESTTSSNEEEVDSTKSTMNDSTRKESLQNVSTEQPSPGGDSEVSIHINITEINGSSMKTEITTENGNNDNTSDSTTNTPTTEVVFINENVTNIIGITTSGLEESNTSSSEEEVISTESTMDNSTRNENLQNVSTEQPSPGGDSEVSIHINITEINGSSMKTEITTENGNNDNTSDSTTNTPTTQVDFMNENSTNIIDITTSGVEETTTSSNEGEVDSTKSTIDISTGNENLQNISTEKQFPGGDAEISIHINITEINGSSMKTEITTENGNDDDTSDSTTETRTTGVITLSNEEEVSSTKISTDISTRNENLLSISTEKPSPGGDSEMSIHINVTEIIGSNIKNKITTESGVDENTSDSTTNTPTTEVDFMNGNVTNIIDITTSGVEESTTSSSEEEVISTESTMDNSTRNENLQNFSTEQPSPGGDSEISIHINITEINGSSIKTDITTKNGNNDNTSDSTRNTPTTQVDFMNKNVTNIIDITTSGVEESTTSSSEEEVISTESTMDNSTRNENLQNFSTEQPSPGGDSEISIHINITEINGSSIKTDIITENGNNDKTSDSTRNAPTTQVDFMNENVTNIIDITTSGVEESTTSSNEEEVDSTKSTMNDSTRKESLQNVSTEQPSPGGDSEVSIHINITEIDRSNSKNEITTENVVDDNTSDSTTETRTTGVNFKGEIVTNIMDITTSGMEESTTFYNEEDMSSTISETVIHSSVTSPLIESQNSSQSGQNDSDSSEANHITQENFWNTVFSTQSPEVPTKLFSFHSSIQIGNRNDVGRTEEVTTKNIMGVGSETISYNDVIQAFPGIVNVTTEAVHSVSTDSYVYPYVSSVNSGQIQHGISEIPQGITPHAASPFRFRLCHSLLASILKSIFRPVLSIFGLTHSSTFCNSTLVFYWENGISIIINSPLGKLVATLFRPVLSIFDLISTNIKQIISNVFRSRFWLNFDLDKGLTTFFNSRIGKLFVIIFKPILVLIDVIYTDVQSGSLGEFYPSNLVITLNGFWRRIRLADRTRNFFNSRLGKILELFFRPILAIFQLIDSKIQEIVVDILYPGKSNSTEIGPGREMDVFQRLIRWFRLHYKSVFKIYISPFLRTIHLFVTGPERIRMRRYIHTFENYIGMFWNRIQIFLKPIGSVLDLFFSWIGFGIPQNDSGSSWNVHTVRPARLLHRYMTL
ncbi:uncharacterized protein [Leptinotarsa decemlineata]|uniref:uncharacterized protein n=1 Tax=Leptinotarsa decemlineata TaxID=7539 RepID=UPI003D308086